MKTNIFIPAVLLFLASCSNNPSSIEVANLVSKAGGCVEAETYLQDITQSNFEKTGSIAPTNEVMDELEKSLQSINASDEKKGNLKKAFKSLYSKLEEQSKKASSSKVEILKALGQLEFGTHPDEKFQKAYFKSLASFKKAAALTLSTCEQPGENDQASLERPEDPITPDRAPRPFFEELQSNTANLSHYGALKSFSVAYQSCEAISIDALTKRDEDAKGITVVGRHSSGRGNKREITSRSAVLRTHPYIKNFRKPASTCVDSTEKPLIYDFGGKPYSTSSKNSTLNFFKNHGSGSKELGVDCSGYVFSSLMSAGLKLSPNKPLRARNVLSIPARSYQNPNSSMSCIQKVKAGKDMELQAGDIFASKGHIFIVNLVGHDPLGVEKALRNNKCSSITHKDFDFTVLQSSPSKGAMGMNHMDGSDYLATSTSMRRGFEKFARLDCENKRKNRLSTPSFSEASLVRHKMTPECISEKVLKLENESCVERCSYKG